MQSYKKLSKLRDETIFILKTRKKELEKQAKCNDQTIRLPVIYALKQFEELFELYEIE